MKMLVLSAMAGSHLAFCQSDTVSVPAFNLHFRNMQANATTLVYINTLGASCDIDAVRLDTDLDLGWRVSIQRTWKRLFGFGHSVERIQGSPFTDYDLLLRFSMSSKELRQDFLLGYTYNTGTGQPFIPYEPSGKMKVGAEVRWNVVSQFAAILFKVNWQTGGRTKPLIVLGVGVAVGIGL